MLPVVKYYPLVGVTALLDVTAQPKRNRGCILLPESRMFINIFDWLLCFLKLKANTEITNIVIAESLYNLNI